MIKHGMLIGLLTCGATGVLQGDEVASWPQFRGADSRGVVEEAGFPQHWSDEQNVAWVQEIAGRGWSSPIVAGDRVFLTTVTRASGDAEEARPGLYFGGERRKPEDIVHAWHLICLNLADGQVLWDQVLHEGKPETPRHIKNSYASETPVTDGKHVYVLIGDLLLACYTVDGQRVWSRSLPAVETRFGWGPAASPVLHGDRLYFVNDNDDESYLAAVDKTTGEEVFKVVRDEKSNWSTPFIWENDQRTEIITPGTGKVRSYDLDGNLLYEFGGCSSITIATPYAAHGLLYVSSGYVLDPRRPVFALRPGARGDISLSEDETSNEYVAWCQKMAAPYNPTTMVYQNVMYVLYDRGMFATFDAQTGRELSARARIPQGRNFTASPWAAKDRVYFLNEFGTTFVYSAGAEPELLHTNKLPEDEALYMSTPALVGDRLLIRSSQKLYCIAP